MGIGLVLFWLIHWLAGGGYSGYLVWRSGADLPGYYGDVIFRMRVGLIRYW